MCACLYVQCMYVGGGIMLSSIHSHGPKGDSIEERDVCEVYIRALSMRNVTNAIAGHRGREGREGGREGGPRGSTNCIV